MIFTNNIFEFAFGAEVNYGKEILPMFHTTNLDFTKDVVGYGFAIRDHIDYDLSFSHMISIDADFYGELNGVIELKTEKSGNAPEKTIPLTLSKKGLFYDIPKFSSDLKQIVFWFPKSMNKEENIKFSIIDIEIFDKVPSPCNILHEQEI